ncbi:MAG: aminotransferase class V-fold PLP-dependent enzyme, partial [Verrucomicrobia bacterium]|nr:aminotransferase class V-fold PLP-dependent enzyme [Verrucomicrobiota bacterium]
VRKAGKTHILISEMEDAPTMRCAKRLEELGCTIKIAPVKKGLIDVDALSKLISPRTALISVTMAHGLTGVIQPAREILDLAKERQVLLHFDAMYAIGKYPMQFESDYLTFSGDRIHSTKGTGGLFAKQSAPLVPLILGGAEQAGLRSGSLDESALSQAAHQSLLYLDTMALEVARLRDLFESSIQGKVLFQEHLRLPNTSLIAFPGVHQEALLYFLHRKGVAAAIGGSYAPHLSTLDETALSFSFSRMTTEEEVVRAAQIINETVQELRRLSEALC